MPGKVTRRKPNGIGAMLQLRYPAHEVPDLDAAAQAVGKTRSAFMYDTLIREVRRITRRLKADTAA